MPEILVSSLISSKNALPRVDITMVSNRVQLSHKEAIDLALNILQCVWAAQADSFIFDFMKKKLNQPDNVAAQIVSEFREHRDKIDVEERNQTHD